VFAISEGGVLGWAAPAVLIAVALAAAATAGFWMVERRHSDPLVRVTLLRTPAC